MPSTDELMYILQNLHWFVLLLGALVFFHELGHFLVAKAFGIKVLKFSLGFGPKLFGVRRGETEYLVSALPLGGYVKMLGDAPGADIPAEDASRAFSAKPVWQRALVLAAGPGFNLLLAFVVYAVMFTGVQTFGDTKVGIVSYGEPAWKAGLRPGDKIVAIDGAPVDDWDALREKIGGRPGERIRITYERHGQRNVAVLEPAAKNEENVYQEVETRGRIGVSVRYVEPLIGVVDSNSPAARVGLRTGDRLLEVGGQQVSAWHEVRAALAAIGEGQSVPLVAERGGQRLQTQLSPGPAPPGISINENFSSADTPWGYTGLVSLDVVVERVDEKTPAAQAGLHPGDRLLSLAIEGRTQPRPIGVWSVDLDAFSGLDARSHFVLAFQRGDKVESVPIRLVQREQKDELNNVRTEYVFGAFNNPDALGTYTYDRRVGLIEAVAESAKQVESDVTLIKDGIVKMMQGRVSFDNMGGPIMLFVIAEKSAKRGAATFFRVMAMISVNLAVLNFLPIPVLDGGHLLFCGIEAVRRRPPSVRVRELANVVGLAILLLLMVLVFKNDFFRYVLG